MLWYISAAVVVVLALFWWSRRAEDDEPEFVEQADAFDYDDEQLEAVRRQIRDGQPTDKLG